MRTKSLDMVVVIAFTVVTVALTLTEGVPEWLRLPFALPTVFLLPGYALFSAVSPQHQLRRTEQAVLSIGLSMMILVLGGFVLNWTAMGLQRQTWAIWLGGLTLGACIVALGRRNNDPTFSPLNLQTGLTTKQGALLLLAILLAVLSWGVARWAAATLPQNYFTQFWMLPAEGGAGDSVAISIHSMEEDTTQYSLEVTAGESVMRWPLVELEPGETWEITIGLPEAEYVQALLYRLDAQDDAAYRRVTLWTTTD